MEVPQFSPRPAADTDDFCTRRAGARKMADAIEAAWASCGHTVRCRVAPIRTGDGRILCYAITSDLKNGLPR